MCECVCYGCCELQPEESTEICEACGTVVDWIDAESFMLEDDGINSQFLVRKKAGEPFQSKWTYRKYIALIIIYICMFFYVGTYSVIILGVLASIALLAFFLIRRIEGLVAR